MTGSKISEIFRAVADILEIKGDNPFRVRAYRNAASCLEDNSGQLDELVKTGNLSSLPGIGKDLEAKIKEIYYSGTFQQYESLKKDIPGGVLAMLQVLGLGPKKVKLFYDKLGIDSIDKLKEAAENGTLLGLEGIKEKTRQNILSGIKLLQEGQSRAPLYAAEKIAGYFIAGLKSACGVEIIEAAGSLRRRKDTVGDIDILMVSEKPSRVMDIFTSLPQVERVLSHGETKSSVIANDSHIQVDLRVVEKDSFGAALLYFTGSKDFNIKLRGFAAKSGYKINEYGVYEGERRVAGKTEKEIFSLLGIDYIPPQLREDRGEIESGIKKNLPRLVELGDIKGDFHTHSVYSDGNLGLREIADFALKQGYEYIAITDHSQSLKVARGLDEKTVYKKIEEIRKLNEEFKGLKILCGSEVDIDKDGKLDYSDSLLKEFDIVIASIHTAFKSSARVMTRRIARACGNKYVNIIAHPTGGIFGYRMPYEINFPEVFKAAADNNVAMEINCYPLRLDLNDTNAMLAKKHRVKIALGTDSHKPEHLSAMRFGIDVACRAWLEKEDIINCLSFEELKKWLDKR